MIMQKLNDDRYSPPNPVPDALVEVIPIALGWQEGCCSIDNTASAQCRASWVEDSQFSCVLVSLHRRVSSNPVLSTGQSPDEKIVPLRPLLIIAVLDKEMPRGTGISEVGESKDLSSDVISGVVTSFDEQDRVASSGEICSDCATARPRTCYNVVVGIRSSCF